MGCLLGCFGRKKNRRRQRRRESLQPRSIRISEKSTKDVHLNLRVPTVEEIPKISDDRIDSRVPAVEEIPKFSVIPTIDICDKAEEEKHSPSPTRKRVTFDSNVKTFEHIAVDESVELLEEKKEEEKPLKSQCSSAGSDVTSNSSGSSYPSNHRYQNCRESDDEEEEEEEEEEEDVTDCDESDTDDENDYCGGFILPEEFYNDDENYEDKLKSWDKEVYTEEIADNVLDTEKKSNASARDRSGYVNAVLNPIENLTQWKAVKSRGGRTTTATATQAQPRMENASLISSDQERKPNASFSLEEPRVSFSNKPRDDETKKQTTQEVAVDASLSTWLSVTSQTTTTSGCSSSVSNYSKPVQSYDERPILGALTSEEIKQFSATNSPRKSPSRSPESPIIGTVGGYWNNHSMATSKYRQV